MSIEYTQLLKYIDQNYIITDDLLQYEENYGFDTGFTIYGTEKVVYRVYSGKVLDRIESTSLGKIELIFDLKTGNVISETINGVI